MFPSFEIQNFEVGRLGKVAATNEEREKNKSSPCFRNHEYPDLKGPQDFIYIPTSKPSYSYLWWIKVHIGWILVLIKKTNEPPPSYPLILTIQYKKTRTII